MCYFMSKIRLLHSSRKWRNILKTVFKTRKIRSTIASLLFIFCAFLFLDVLYPINTNISYSTIIYAQDSTLLHGFLTPDEKWRMYTTLDEITPELKKAIVFKEDKYFHYHYGVNPIAIARAIFYNIKSRRRTSGASTISMQVARLLDPKPRTYSNKIKEMFRATQLEWHYTKNEILQLYLNLAPFGGNIEGVKAASVIYFGKLPSHLSIGEIATLSIIPNRPVSLRLGKNNEYIKQQRNKWLNRYKQNNLFPKQNIDDAIDEPINAYRHNVPRMAPHISHRLKNKYPKQNIIYSSIDCEIQRKLESIVKNYSQSLYFQNIKNATCLVIDNKSHKVKAYIGSADFFNNEDGGQVDGITAIRSPGSTLKPLLYAMAIDKGLITPKYCIADVPFSLSGYEPENYDGKFYGNISIEFALAKSLNVPAVKVLNKLGIKTFIDKLSQINFTQIKSNKNNLGLSIALGGCGSKLEELTTMYSAFANEGRYQNISFIQKKKNKPAQKMISKASAFMITEILTQLTRPDLPLAWANSKHMPKIAWKTGTSYGRRDAWSIGYNKKYTVGTWVGNFSGEGVPELSGASKASPLLFKIFNTIDHNSESEWFSMPDEVSFRAVCPETGLLPSKHCSNDMLDYYIPGVSSMQTCQHIKIVPIAIDSSVSYCTSCKPHSGYIKAEYPNLSPEIIAYYEVNHIDYLKIPPHNQKCERIIAGKAPQITSPIHKNKYYVDVNNEMQIKLSCQVSNDVNKIYWYINKKFFKAVKPSESIFFDPEEGKIQISCSDDKGRNTDIYIDVKHINL